MNKDMTQARHVADKVNEAYIIERELQAQLKLARQNVSEILFSAHRDGIWYADIEKAGCLLTRNAMRNRVNNMDV